MSDIETQKTGYNELIELCVADERKNELKQFVSEMKDYNGDEDYLTTLNFVKNYLDDNGIHFIMALDWKQDVKDLVWRIASSLRDNFHTVIKLPDYQSFGQHASVSTPNVFSEYNQSIMNESFKIGFIDTQSDEYVIVIHRISDEHKVADAIKKIGYKYLDVNSLSMSL